MTLRLLTCPGSAGGAAAGGAGCARAGGARAGAHAGGLGGAARRQGRAGARRAHDLLLQRHVLSNACADMRCMELPSCMSSLSWKAGSVPTIVTCRVPVSMLACKAGRGLHAGGGAAAALPGGRGCRGGAGGRCRGAARPPGQCALALTSAACSTMFHASFCTVVVVQSNFSQH